MKEKTLKQLKLKEMKLIKKIARQTWEIINLAEQLKELRKEKKEITPPKTLHDGFICPLN